MAEIFQLSIFSVIAIRMTNMNSIFGIVNLVNLPLMFVSYAMFAPGMMAVKRPVIVRTPPTMYVM